jgi:hypothetical protein
LVQLRNEIKQANERLATSEQKLAARPTVKQHDALRQQRDAAAEQLAKTESQLEQLRKNHAKLRSDYESLVQRAEPSVEAQLSQLLQQPRSSIAEHRQQSPATAAPSRGDAGPQKPRAILRQTVESEPAATTTGLPVDSATDSVRPQPARPAPSSDSETAKAQPRPAAGAVGSATVFSPQHGRDLKVGFAAWMPLLQAAVVLACSAVFFYCGHRNATLQVVWYTAATLAAGLAMFFCYDLTRGRISAIRRTSASASLGSGPR